MVFPIHQELCGENYPQNRPLPASTSVKGIELVAGYHKQGIVGSLPFIVFNTSTDEYLMSFPPAQFHRVTVIYIHGIISCLIPQV